MWTIRRYRPEDKDAWDAFVRESRNATFLHARGYMDYHSDRFEDSSRMVFKGNRLMALLPANITADGVLHSHQGLTYGGWLLPREHIDGSDLLEIFEAAAEAWREDGIKEFDYKPVPYIYCLRPSQEDEYALFRMGAELTECNLSSAIDLRSPGEYNKLRRRQLAKAHELGLLSAEMSDAEEFMELVENCLQERHDVHAVHTAAEIALLKSRFPENIRMFAIRGKGSCRFDAGVMIYDTGLVAHAQYIATTPLGREQNLLSLLFDKLIRYEYADRRYFDFGISNEEHGLYLNAGLLRQKRSYGATGVAYNRYRLKLQGDGAIE